MQPRSFTPPFVVLTALTTLAGCSAGSGGTTTTSSTPKLSTLSSPSQSGGVLQQIPRNPTFSASTVPGNGDLNPYGVAFVPGAFPSGGKLSPGDVIVANFNNSQNLQGTGTTIVRVDPSGGAPTVFFADATEPGFSTATGVMAAGFVVQGNVPSVNGDGVCNDLDTDVGAGSLTFIDKSGNNVQRIVDSMLLDGPWDLTVADDVTSARVFVANVKSGTVTRVNLTFSSTGMTVVSRTQVASGYPHRCDPAAFVVGPTGLAFDGAANVLYVASTDENAIFAVAGAGDAMSDQGKGNLVVQDNTHFHGPLGLVRADNGDLISAQGDAVNPLKSKPSEIVEVGPTGTFLSQFSVDHAAGSAFGVALTQTAGGSRFAAVNDATNTLEVWNF